MAVHYAILMALLSALGAAGLLFAVLSYYERLQISGAKRRVEEILNQANRDAENSKKQALLDAREGILKEREKLLGEVEKSRNEVHDFERRLDKKEDQLKQKLHETERKERLLEAGQRKAADGFEQCEKRKQALDKILNEQKTLLQKITGLDAAQAERLLLQRLENEFEDEISRRLTRFEQELKSRQEEKAREILATAIQRYAAQHTAETTVSTIDLASDDLKGRIIGREGRNIRAFEKATGIDVIVDDTPGIVVVSGFDNVRREIARIAMLKLIADGRIHPARIEEVVTATREEFEQHIKETGKKAAAEVGIVNLHDKLLDLLGRLKFRTSYSQNVLQHSIEVSFLAGLIADEMGLDVDLARRCGLLHDVGKAIDHEVEGGHPQVGADVARRCGENEVVLHAIAGHHDDVRVDKIYTVLVAIGDAISASRPGARRETLEKYVKRLEDLETLVCEFPGVESAYAIQAGREVRVIASSENTTDKSAAKICHDIAKAIEEKLKYPGEIKVTVLRETRAVEYAR